MDKGHCPPFISLALKGSYGFWHQCWICQSVSCVFQEDSSKTVPETVSIIDAIDFVGVNKFHYLMLCFCIGVHLGAIVAIVVISYVMTTANKELNMSSSQQGVLGSMCFLGMVAGALFWGVAMDVGGRHLTLSVALTCDAIVGIFSSSAASYQLLSFSRFFTGFFIQGSVTSALTCLGEFLPPQFRSKGIVIFGAAPGLANIMTAGVAWMVHALDWKIVFPWGFRFEPWRILLILASVPPLVLTIIATFVPESPMYLVRQRRTEEAHAVMQRIWAYGSTRPPSEFPIKEILMPPEEKSRNFLRQACHQARSLFMRRHIRKTIILSIISFSVITGYNGTLAWVPEIVGRVEDFEKKHPGRMLISMCEVMVIHNKSSVQSNFDGRELIHFNDEFPDEIKPRAYIFALTIGMCILFMSMVGCFIINFLGNKLALTILLVVNACLCVGLAFVPGGLIGFVALMAVLIPFGVLCMAAYSAITLELYETEVRGMAINMVMMCGRLGSMISNLIFGHLIDSYCNFCFIYVAFLLLASAILAIFLPPGRATPHLYRYVDSAISRSWRGQKT